MNAISSVVPFEESGREQLNNRFEIIIADAACEIVCGGEKICLSAGETAVIPPLTRRAVKGKGLRVTLEQALLPVRSIKRLTGDDAAGVMQAAKKAFTYVGAKDCAGILEALGGLMAAYINHCCGGEFSPVVQAVRDDADKNLSDPTYSLEDFMHKLPLNYDYVRKLFKKETGLTPREYLLFRRMELARGLIGSRISNQYSNWTVSQIAEACGFSEPLYFSRVFKKYYGKSPSAFAAERKK